MFAVPALSYLRYFTRRLIAGRIGIGWPLLMLALCACLLSCSVQTTQTSGPPEVIDARAEQASSAVGPGGQQKEPGLMMPPRQQQDAAIAAVDQLLLFADQAIANGQLDRAAATIERAIRLSPGDARSYFSLAQVRYRQGHYDQVRVLVDKASKLARDDRVLQRSIMEFAQRIALSP